MMILTKEEKAWLKQVNKILAKCPPRLTFYAGGDCSLAIIDGDHTDDINNDMADPIVVAQKNGWLAVETLEFPQPVSAVCF